LLITLPTHHPFVAENQPSLIGKQPISLAIPPAQKQPSPSHPSYEAHQVYQTPNSAHKLKTFIHHAAEQISPKIYFQGLDTFTYDFSNLWKQLRHRTTPRTAHDVFVSNHWKI
jgi:hypothetical protein